MSKVNKHRVVIEGKEFTRNSEGKVYTHAVIARCIEPDTKDWVSRDKEWAVRAWCSSRALAEKQTANWRGGPTKRRTIHGWKVYNEARWESKVVEVELVEAKTT